jgi:hypothetical protein
MENQHEQEQCNFEDLIKNFLEKFLENLKQISIQERLKLETEKKLGIMFIDMNNLDDIQCKVLSTEIIDNIIFSVEKSINNKEIQDDSGINLQQYKESLKRLLDDVTELYSKRNSDLYFYFTKGNDNKLIVYDLVK